MAHDDRIATGFLMVSIALHLSLLVHWPWPLLPETPPRDETPRVQYVVRVPQAPPAPTAVPAPAARQPQPELPAAASAVQARQPQPVEPHQPPQRPITVEKAPQPQVQSAEREPPETMRPRRPVQAPPQATAVRPQKLPPLPQVAQLPRQPAQAEWQGRALPRQPEAQPQQTPAPPARPATPGQPDPLSTYLAEVRAAIDRQKRYPGSARRSGMTGHVVLQFTILPDGRVIESRVAETNGHNAFAGAALDSLRRASPLPPFPADIQQERLVVRVPIAYKLTE